MPRCFFINLHTRFLGNVRDNVHYLTELEVLYPAGANIVVYNSEKKTQRFVPLENERTTGFASKTGNIFKAVYRRVQPSNHNIHCASDKSSQ